MKSKIVEDINNGVLVNDNFSLYLAIKDDKDYERWKQESLKFYVGTYKNRNLLDTIEAFGQINICFVAKEYIENLKRILQNGDRI